jgi:16S rRNA (cytosine967-C5)-methyltransferase
VLAKGLRADEVLAALRRSHPEWDDAAWAATASAVYDVVRYRLLLEGAAGDTDAAKLLRVWHAWRGLAREPVGALRARLEELRRDFRVRESMPEWLDRVGREELGEPAWEALVPRLNEPPHLYVRANTLRITRDELARRLQEGGTKAAAVAFAPDALDLALPGSVYRTPEHAGGLMEVQDAASQAVTLRLGAAPGMRVIDGCAGAGGKTLHLAALMGNRGRVLALDTDAERLTVLRRRARRAGASIVEARVVDTTKVVKRRHGSADRLLLDVPCSGLGVLRRNPDARWRLTPDALERLRATQREILRRYAPLVKPGGRMAYVTCSVLPSEGEAQIRQLLDAGGWVLISEERLGPPREDTDCFYVALLERCP